MASYLIPIIMFAMAVLLVVLDRRNDKSLGPEFYSEYLKTKIVPTSILFPVILGGILLGVAKGIFDFSDRVTIILVAVYGLGMFILFRSIKEKNIRKIDLPAGFVRRERFYDFAISLTFLLLLVLVWFI